MSILEGIKAANYKGTERVKFIIKSKGSLKENKDVEQVFNDSIVASDKDVEQFLEYMITRSTRFRQLLEQRKVTNEVEFFQKYLMTSVCIKTILKSVLEKMLSQRRLGKNLKGMNKSNLNEIQNCIWACLDREISLYQNQLDYQSHKSFLLNQLGNRKIQVLKEIQLLEHKKQTFLEEQLLLTNDQEEQLLSANDQQQLLLINNEEEMDHYQKNTLEEDQQLSYAEQMEIV